MLSQMTIILLMELTSCWFDKIIDSNSETLKMSCRKANSSSYHDPMCYLAMYTYISLYYCSLTYL